jgi:DUF4097 and DUF4098 domain-containing protein YvlB
MLVASTLVALLFLPAPSPPTVAWHKSFNLQGRPEIQVVSNNADVRVYASDRKDIEAVLYADKAIPADTVSGHESGNRVTLDVRVPPQGEAGFNHHPPVLEVKIPLGCDINVHSAKGSILVKSAEGKLSLHAENGNIEAVGIRGTLDIESGHGDLKADGNVTAVSLRARTGNIAAQIYSGSKMNSRWALRTGDGNVDLRLPADFSTDLDVSSGDGNVRVDFPRAMIGGGGPSTMRGPINGGGQHLEVHSDKGNIMVRKIAGSV